MKIEFELNGSMTEAEIRDDACLKDTLRELGCASVKCGCDTANCGMCTVLVDDRPMLSCAYLSARANGKKITTLEGLTDEAVRFAECMAEEGADQCGFCNPGFVVNVIAFKRYLMKAGKLKNWVPEGTDNGTEHLGAATESPGKEKTGVGTGNRDVDKEKKGVATADTCVGTGNRDVDKEKKGAATADTCVGTEEIREFLAGNICRCTGYASQERAIMAYLSRAENSNRPL